MHQPDIRAVRASGRPIRREATPLSPDIIVGLLRFADAAIVILTGVLAYVVFHGWEIRSEYAAAICFGAFTILVFLTICGEYRHEVVLEPAIHLKRILLAWILAAATLLASAYMLKISSNFSRSWGGAWFLFMLAGAVVERCLFMFLVERWTRDYRLANRTLIIGAGEHGQRLAAYLNASGDSRTRVLGFIDDRQTRVPKESHGYALLGNVDYAIQLIRAGKVDQVFIALPWTAEARILSIVKKIASTPVNIRMAPDLIGFSLPHCGICTVAGLTVHRILDRPISGWPWVVKQVEDYVCGGILVFMSFPLMVAIACAIKLDSPGPVFFRQRRYGFNDEPIEVFKFRTMYADQLDADCVVQTTRNDRRVTPVGRHLRAWSLDELAQLLNVMRGEMSLVGPRPHAMATKAEGCLFEEVVDRYAARHRVKPGITGWAQVNGWRGETDTIEKITKRVEHDLYYIDNWSIWLDMRILLRTLGAVVRRENAF